MPYKHDYDRALTRLVDILSKLYKGEKPTIKELAEEFGVCTKTIQRDFSQRLYKFPIVRDGNRFCMEEGYRLEKRHDIKDMLVLDVLERISEGIGAEFATRALALLSKLKNDDFNPLYTKIEMEDISKKAHEIALLESAIKEKREIAFLYDFGDFSYGLDVQPLRIICFDGFWYLLGVDARNGIIKKYYLNGILDIEIKESRFIVKKELQERLGNAINIWFDANEKPFKVTLLADAEIAKYLHRRPIAKSQIIESIGADGAMELSLKITNYYEVVPAILFWIPHLKVVSPKELDDIVKERLQGYLDSSCYPVS